MTDYIGRFAPSPTGPLHLGSLVAATASYLDARAAGGQWLLRIEDIDPPRELPGAANEIVATLKRFGFSWDGPVRFQSERIATYRRKLDKIADRTFFCTCSRRDVRLRQEQLHILDGRYPGTCRDAKHATGVLRFQTEHAPSFVDLFQGDVPARRTPDDFILWRRDDLPSYQLAVAIDDADQRITHVIRGADLLPTTGRFLALLRALDAPTLHFGHVPLVVHANGQKLSKQNGAEALPIGNELELLKRTLSAIGYAKMDLDGITDLASLWTRAIALWDRGMLSNRGHIPVFM